MAKKQPYQNRTAIVQFGTTKQDYLDLVQSEDRKALIAHLQAPLQAQLSVERHKPGCADTSRYTIHGLREHQVQSWLGQQQKQSLSAECVAKAVEQSSPYCPVSSCGIVVKMQTVWENCWSLI